MRTIKLAAALMGGAALAAPLSARAQSQEPPPPATAQPGAAPAEAPAPPPQILDRDGNPLPPELQREGQERFRTPAPAPGARPARPEAPAARTSPADRDGNIVVQGQRPRGSVTLDIPPERTFSPLDINAYGVSTVGELLRTLGPQVSSNRGDGDGAPITLLNGRRVSSFAEIAEIPTEAIERMEVFPEELALRYGYRPDQKVVNIVTLERYDSLFGQLGATVATEGGYDTASLQANYFAITGSTRFDFGLDYNRSTPLLESDRDLAQFGGGVDAGSFRTLLPATERLALSGLVSGNLLPDVSTTLTGRFEASGNAGRFGSDAGRPLTQDTDGRAVQLGTTLHGDLGRWLWTFTGRYERLRTDIFADTGGPARGRDRAQSVDAFADATLLLSGSLLRLPAGPVSATIRTSAQLRDFAGFSLRSGVGQQAELSRESGLVQLNLNVPLAGRGAGSLGQLSLNANAELERVSRYGTLHTILSGINWSPVPAVNLIATASIEQSAPTVEQLGAPLLTAAGVRTFDFTRRETVDVSQLFGGNPDLLAEERRVLRVGATVRPLPAADLTISADYVSTRIDDPIVPFPLVTAEVEAAFPERFTRAAGGRLVQIDSRPLNFAGSRQDQLRWGVNFVRPLGAAEPWMRTGPVRTFANEAEARAALPPGTMVAVVQPGSAMARRFENLASRLYVSLYHSWRLRDEVSLRPGLPALDLLDGAATDLRGGTRRHRLELQAGVFRRGLGARITADWQSGTTLRSPGSAAGDLSFSGLATVNLNLFADLGDAFAGAGAPGWLTGTRLTFGITNLFDARPQVRDPFGSTPLPYQPAYLDPLGRLISFSVRKLF